MMGFSLAIGDVPFFGSRREGHLDRLRLAEAVVTVRCRFRRIDFDGPGLALGSFIDADIVCYKEDEYDDGALEVLLGEEENQKQ